MGILIVTTGSDEEVSEAVSRMDAITNAWTAQAARGECGWICSDCCMGFPDGMPDTCPHGDERCTRIIQRDKAHAKINNPTSGD